MEISKKKFFFIGVGGSGMSSLAHILLDIGAEVWGTDQKESQIVLRLKDRGLIFETKLENLKNVSFDYVVYSSAVNKEENIYYKSFSSSRVVLLHRSELMHKIFSLKKSISVAGSHGKTTTTAMIASILLESGLDPAIMVGGDMPTLGDKGGYFGKGEWGVYESDESDGTFLNHKADIQVLTNIDNDHLDYYKTLNSLYESFEKFLSGNPNSKKVVLLDDPGVKKVIERIKDLKNFYCITSDSSLREKSFIHYFVENGKLFFTIENKSFQLQTPFAGRHYLTNALCASLACLGVGISIEKSLSILQNYKGVRRRLEYLGNYKTIKVYDDYGHHPTEIQAVISSLLSMKTHSSQRVFIIFQPHRYTRTKEHFREFARVLSEADFCTLLPIYSAGEKPIEGVSSSLIFENMKDKSKVQILSGNKEKDILEIKSLLKENDLVVCLGAGNVREWGEILIQSHTPSSFDK